MTLPFRISRPLLAYLALSLAWGTTYNASRVAVSHFPPMAFAGIRFLLSAALFLGFARLAGAVFPSRRSDYLRLALLSVLTLTLAHGLTLYALQWVHSGVTAVTVSIGPVFVALLDSLRQRKSALKVRGWTGLFVCVAGVWFLVSAGNRLGSIDLPGAAILVSAALIFAFGQIYLRHSQITGSITAQAGIQMLMSGLSFCLVSVLMGETPRIHFSHEMWQAMAYLILVGSVIGYGAFFYLYRHWPVSRASTYSYINNVVSVVIGALLLHEPVNAAMVLAMAVIMAGVVLVQTAHAPSP